MGATSQAAIDRGKWTLACAHGNVSQRTLLAGVLFLMAMALAAS
jgi:hypothetical protein